MFLNKSKVILLPTTEKSLLYKEKGILYFNLANVYNENSSKKQNQHLYVLLNETIKEGDYFFYECIGALNAPLLAIKENEKYWKNNKSKKIIATTDTSIACVKDVLSIFQRKGLTNHYPTEKWILPQPHPSFIKKYVKEFSKGNIITDVVVEYERFKERHGDGRQFFMSKRLKINPKDNTINIKTVKDSWNRKELNSFARWMKHTDFNVHGYSPEECVEKWIEENF